MLYIKETSTTCLPSYQFPLVTNLQMALPWLQFPIAGLQNSTCLHHGHSFHQEHAVELWKQTEPCEEQVAKQTSPFEAQLVKQIAPCEVDVVQQTVPLELQVVKYTIPYEEQVVLQRVRHELLGGRNGKDNHVGQNFSLPEAF